MDRVQSERLKPRPRLDEPESTAADRTEEEALKAEPACTESKLIIDFTLKLPDVLNLECLVLVELL